jgi:D-3-phosphoglycerate dehydrogenase
MNLKDCRLLITPTSFGKNDPGMKTELEALVGEVIYNPAGKPLTSQEVARLLPGIDGFIAGLDAIDAEALKSADRLKVIARYGVGYDKVDLQAAREKGIVVTNTPGANSVSVAELAIGLMLTLARGIPESITAIHQGEWPRPCGLSLEGKTVGIVGLGAVGRQLAKRLAAFDCTLVAYDPFPNEAFAKKYAIRLAGLDELLPVSDFVSLHLPVLPDTREMVNADFLRKMKPGAILINTARGELVNEKDLYDALEAGHLRGVGLDTFQKEPPDLTNPLLTLPQVICTPHLGAQTDSATNNMGRMAMEDCLAVLRNEKPKYRVN